jgi:chromosome segregation ATPase
MSNLDQELEQVVQKRKRLRADIERLRGRKEQAEANLAQIEAECRSKNIDPEKIDQILEQLETKYRDLVEELKRDTDAAERALAPFVGGM